MEQMTAVRLYRGESKVTLETVNRPTPGPNEALVKVKVAGICHSDLGLIDGSGTAAGLPPVVTLGHEVAGIVEEVGPGVRDASVGTRVLVDPLDRRGPNRTLGVHFDGGWADYVVVPATCLVPIPDSIPFDQAAIVPDAVSNPWAALREVADVKPGESVGIWGVGGLGTHAVMLARLMGAAPIIAVDPNEEARNRARALGADIVLDPAVDDIRSTVFGGTSNQGLDVVINYVGRAAVIESILQVLGRDGRLVLAGMGEEPFSVPASSTISRNRWRIIGQYGLERAHIDDSIRLIEWQRIDLSASITKTYPLDKAPEALQELRDRSGSVVRIALVPE